MPSEAEQVFTEQWSTAAKEAYQQATDELHKIAKDARYEASIVIDAFSGKRVDEQIGEAYAVTYEPAKSANCAEVIALHVHIDESPNSNQWC